MLFKLVLMFLTVTQTQAAVWETENQWNLSWETKYQDWIKSDSYTRHMFQKNGPLGEVKTDCADAVFGARIIFSYLHKLPFAVGNTTGDRTDHYSLVSNELNIWDGLEEKYRVARFIEYIGETVGTDYLARHATFSLNPKMINAGDTYIYNKQSSHAYMIKTVEATGNQRLWWSTTPKAIRELSEKVGLPGSDFSSAPWGYRRFKWPEQLNEPASTITEEQGYSPLQYELAEKEKENILKAIKGLRAVNVENLPETIQRYFKNICMAMQDRVGIVNLANEYVTQNGGKCLNRAEFDDYSTPTRDNRILEEIEDLISIWNEALLNHQDQTVQGDLRLAMAALFKRGAITSSGSSGFPFPRGSSKRGVVEPDGRAQLKAMCSVDVGNSKIPKLDLLDYYMAKRGGRMSYHPNDSIFYRWGIETGRKSTCREF